MFNLNTKFWYATGRELKSFLIVTRIGFLNKMKNTWSLSSASNLALALASSSLTLSYFYWLIRSCSTSFWRQAIMPFFWSIEAGKSSVLVLSVALLAFLIRLIFGIEIRIWQLNYKAKIPTIIKAKSWWFDENQIFVL